MIKSRIVYVILLGLLLLLGFTYYPKHTLGGGEATISWDVSGYYWYLPAAFIYHDLRGLSFSDSLRDAYGCSPDNQQITILPDGKKVLKYSSGMALQYLPFFLLAHTLAPHLGYPADGLSPPYQYAVFLGALVMMSIGLWYLQKVLLRYFQDKTVALLLICVTLGTNYLDYTTIDVGMTHAWLFAWYALLLYQCDTFYQSPHWKRAIGIGCITGLLCLTRPTEWISIFIALGWGLNLVSLQAWQTRIQVYWKNRNAFILMMGMPTLFALIQFSYWKYATGHWLVYSYGDQHFSWTHPHVFLYSLNFRSGWLIYCPLMLLPILGCLLAWKRPALYGSILFVLLLYYYQVSAWDIWWYGGRAMIQSYPLWMFPLGALIELCRKHRFLFALFLFAALAGIYMNLWWTHGVHRGGYVYATDMSKAYYKKIAGHWTIDEQDRKLLDVEDDYTGRVPPADTLLHVGFNQGLAHEVFEEGRWGYYLMAGEAAGRSFTVSHPPRDERWYRLQMDVTCSKPNWDILRMAQVGIRFWKGGECIKANQILLDRLFYKLNSQQIWIDALSRRETYDSIQVFIIQPAAGGGSFRLRDLTLSCWPVQESKP